MSSELHIDRYDPKPQRWNTMKVRWYCLRHARTAVSLSKVHSAPSTPQKAIQHASIIVLPGIPFDTATITNARKYVFPSHLSRFASVVFGCRSVRACPVALGSLMRCVNLLIYLLVLSSTSSYWGMIIRRDSVVGWEGKAEAKVDRARKSC
ncbi:hypothetical protein BO94DRAFT_7003 [Aspergillus sclerotioniger CBS 115572]|uniref:Uncharacterized protein n=1 Tax=Aspergillus sclerotioniger CBS 115572 TaxID=1450535 RepID=A0A317XCT3_9EURO|nr:hypothetical protein BO94DRAFT_7003 [Aspergillus sclerotioniger CBS 115572]PWY96353.1 hypothetical protein BO94DRAFT_7003 [Aspergillus sclerotioniger CBS 115572]